MCVSPYLRKWTNFIHHKPSQTVHYTSSLHCLTESVRRWAVRVIPDAHCTIEADDCGVKLKCAQGVKSKCVQALLFRYKTPLLPKGRKQPFSPEHVFPLAWPSEAPNSESQWQGLDAVFVKTTNMEVGFHFGSIKDWISPWIRKLSVFCQSFSNLSKTLQEADPHLSNPAAWLPHLSNPAA